MPYNPDNPPDKVKDLSKKKQRQWVHVFNSCWGEHGDEGKCHAMAWGVVKKSAYSVANKVDGRKAASELLSVARDILREDG